MDYKEKYEMALEGIQEILGSGEDSIKMSRLQLRLQGIFPELKESEDDKIRKFLIQMAQNGHGRDKDWWNKCVAWLEKQSEQKDILEGAVLDSNKDGLIADTIRCKRENQDEQKPYGLRGECKDCQCNYTGECKGSVL